MKYILFIFFLSIISCNRGPQPSGDGFVVERISCWYSCMDIVWRNEQYNVQFTNGIFRLSRRFLPASYEDLMNNKQIYDLNVGDKWPYDAVTGVERWIKN